MNTNERSSHTNLFIAFNSAFFIFGIAGFFLQNAIVQSISILVLSLLFLLYLLVQPVFQYEEDAAEVPDHEDSEDVGKIQLALKVQELTETNEQLSMEIHKLKDSLKEKEAKAPSLTQLYKCPLTASIPVDMNSFLQDYMKGKSHALKERNIHVSYQALSEQVPVNLSTSAMELVLDNLFDNVLKFTPPDGSLYVRLASKDTKEMLLILKNTCKPIADSDVHQIFKLNYQGNNHLLGSGLGLAQVKAIIDDFGGKIWTKTTGENCFTVYIELPLYMTNETIISDEMKG